MLRPFHDKAGLAWKVHVCLRSGLEANLLVSWLWTLMLEKTELRLREEKQTRQAVPDVPTSGWRSRAPTLASIQNLGCPPHHQCSPLQFLGTPSSQRGFFLRLVGFTSHPGVFLTFCHPCSSILETTVKAVGSFHT